MSDILANVGNLVRNEADLARTEIGENVKKAGASLAAMVVAAGLAMTGLNVIAASLMTLVIWAGLSPEWASFAVGAGFLLVALILFFSAKSSLQQIGFVPTRAARQVSRDAAAIKESFNDK